MPTFSDVTSKLKDTRSEMIVIKNGKHIGWALSYVRFEPSTLAQAKRQIEALKSNTNNNLLMCGEWYGVEEFLNKFGFTGNYEFTKSGSMVRLENIADLISAIKIKFDIN